MFSLRICPISNYILFKVKIIENPDVRIRTYCLLTLHRSTFTHLRSRACARTLPGTQPPPTTDFHQPPPLPTQTTRIRLYSAHGGTRFAYLIFRNRVYFQQIIAIILHTVIPGRPRPFLTLTAPLLSQNLID